jgi:hypothetical protein
MYKTMAQIRAEITVRGRPENFISQTDAGGNVTGRGGESSASATAEMRAQGRDRNVKGLETTSRKNRV